jgi:hypothetical protein
MPRPSEVLPTATQSVMDGQETPATGRTPKPTPVGSGRLDQCLPPLWVVRIALLPTATHCVAEGQDMAPSGPVPLGTD